MKDARSEAEIQSACKKLLKTMGFGVWSTSQGKASAVTRGTPDLFVAGCGITFWIEVKAGYNKQTPGQAKFQRKVEANGGHYLLVYSEQDVADWINGWRAA